MLREIEEAVRLGRNIVPLIEEGADFAREIGFLPDGLGEALRVKNGIRLLDDYFEAGMERLRTRFLKTPQNDIRIIEAPAADRVEVQRRLQAIDVGTRPAEFAWPTAPAVSERSAVIDLLPAPFAWIDIPAGEVTIEGRVHPVRGG